jgi:hypothetical protein
MPKLENQSRTNKGDFVKKLLFLVIATGLLVACSGPEDGKNGKNGSSCSVQQAANGAVVLCTDGTSAIISNGTNGLNGTDGQDGVDGTNGQNGTNGHDGLPGMDGRNGVDAVVEIIDPCGDNPGQFDEVLLRLSTGELLAYFESGSNRFLSLIGNGSYSTTDSQHCHFTVNNGVVHY